MYLISACLAGVNCRYDGKNSLNEVVTELVKQGKAVLVCPEQFAGLPTPRICCEINTTNKDEKKVIGRDGKDYTKEFLEGSEKTLEIAKLNNIHKAILKAKSPSCGCGLIYDGTFSGKLIAGDGLAAELLIKNGIEVITENELNLL